MKIEGDLKGQKLALGCRNVKRFEKDCCK